MDDEYSKLSEGFDALQDVIDLAAYRQSKILDRMGEILKNGE
jgi:hypothetical protein